MNCQELNQGLRQNFQPPWPRSQTLRWKNAIFICMWNCFVLLNGELAFPNGRNFISWYFSSQIPKRLFILFQYTNVYLCANFSDLKPTIDSDEKRRLQIWTCFWARSRSNIAQVNCYFLSAKCFIIDNQSSWSTDCAAENSKRRVMLRIRKFGTNVGTNHAKTEKISISRAIRLGFLRSLVCAMWTLWS